MNSFSNKPLPKNFEDTLKQIHNSISLGTSSIISIFLFIGGVIVLIRGLEILKFWYIFLPIFATFFVGYFFISKNKKKLSMAKSNIIWAIEYISKNKKNEALDSLLNAIELYQNPILWNCILELSQSFNSPANLVIRTIEIENKFFYKKAPKNDKIQEISKQMNQLIDFIKKHSIIVDKSQKSIENLTNKQKIANDPNFIQEYSSLINRYNNIIELENSKIEFYKQAISNLLKLKQNHINFLNLQQEKAKLVDFENKLLEKTIKEQYSRDVEDFLLFENTYLQTLQEYSKDISLSENNNIFEQLTQEFKNKTERI